MENATKEISLGNENLFYVDNGKRIRKEDIHLAKGEIPVYSTSKFESEVLGRVSDDIRKIVPEAKKFDGKFITVNADGSVGKVFLREGTFYLNDVVNIVKIKNQKLCPEFILYILQNKLLSLGYSSWSNKLYKNKLREVDISIPVDKKGEFDLKKQEEIATKYSKIKRVKKEIKNIFQELINLKVNFEQKYSFVDKPLHELFEQVGGNSKYTKSFVFKNKGKYPVYSANTKQRGLFGHLNTFDHNLECLQLTTNGVYAGTFFYRKKHKFSINGDARLLIRKSEKIDYKYMLYELRNVFLKQGFNWENKPSQSKIENIFISIPVDKKGEFDLKKQEEIATKYSKIEEIKKKISEDFTSLQELNVEVN